MTYETVQQWHRTLPNGATEWHEPGEKGEYGDVTDRADLVAFGTLRPIADPTPAPKAAVKPSAPVSAGEGA
jgi:hypothetical protein